MSNGYRKFLKKECEKCNGNYYLEIHHKDYDRNNNSEDNCQTLCRNCHWREHNFVPEDKKEIDYDALSEEKEKVGIKR